jgi:hypothetical protein
MFLSFDNFATLGLSRPLLLALERVRVRRRRLQVARHTGIAGRVAPLNLVR